LKKKAPRILLLKWRKFRKRDWKRECSVYFPFTAKLESLTRLDVKEV
jgi:hypothetical protein